MYETGVYVGLVTGLLASLWLPGALILAVFKARRRGALKHAKISAIVFVLAFGGMIYCNQNVYKDYGLSSSEELTAVRAAQWAERDAASAAEKAKAEAAGKQDRERQASEAVAAEAARQCGVGTVVAVTADYDIRVSPGEESDRIVNEKATSILKETHYHQIDTSTSVEIIGCKDDWTEVRITEPAWLTFVHGWAPNGVLRGIERSTDGARVYVESDVLWDKDTAKHKPEIVTMINKISREHAGCTSIDAASVAKSSSRSKPDAPVFFVTCDPSGTPFNVWFRPDDVTKAMTAPTPIDQGNAVLACEQAAKDRATHPSTVDFSRFLSVAYSARPDGRVSLTSSFTARNSFNLELTFSIRCLFDGNQMIEAVVSEQQ